MTRLSVMICLTVLGCLLLLPEPMDGCAVVRRRGRPSAPPVRIEVAAESAIIIWDAAHKTEHFISRASFKTAAGDFGFLVPTPTRPQLAEAPDSAFAFLKKLTAPPVKIVEKERPNVTAKSGKARIKSARHSVEVLETKRVAGYDAVILAAGDPDALNDWLKQHGYQSSPELATWLKPYVHRQWLITAFKIAADVAKTASINTAAVHMTFQTERPFFPYSEPAEPREGDAVAPSKTPGPPRLLRIYFLGDQRTSGTLGQNGAWPGKTLWANQISQADQSNLLQWLKLDRFQPDHPWWLTEIEDRSSPRPGNDDVYFSPSTDQSIVTKPPIIQYRYVRPAKRPKATPRSTKPDDNVKP